MPGGHQRFLKLANIVAGMAATQGSPSIDASKGTPARPFGAAVIPAIGHAVVSGLERQVDQLPRANQVGVRDLRVGAQHRL
jgi:hypothetical protein